MTNIEWTHRPGTRGESWNPIVGCSIHSPGCTNCYAMPMAERIQRMMPDTHYRGTTARVKDKAVWTGSTKLAPEKTLRAPLRASKPRTYFVNSMGDLFHESVPDEWIDRVFGVMALCPQHTFLVLTKRAQRMRNYVVHLYETDEGMERMSDAAVAVSGSPCAAHVEDTTPPLPNVWLGVSAERQQEADARIPDLLATPAAVRFVSAEPLLGPIDFGRLHLRVTDAATGRTVDIANPFNAFRGNTWTTLVSAEHAGKRFYSGGSSGYGCLDWIIVGGESGPDARPMHPDWARSIRDQCTLAGVPFFFKQWGEWRSEDASFACSGDVRLPWGIGQPSVQRIGKSRAGHLLDGVEHFAWPEQTPATPEPTV